MIEEVNNKYPTPYFTFAIDATMIEDELGWKADENFESGILKTIEWYLGKYC